MVTINNRFDIKY